MNKHIHIVSTRPVPIVSPRRVSRWAKPKERPAAKDIAPSVADRQTDLIQFYTKYEHLVDTICAAAQYGPESKLERAYSDLREWMLRNYAEVRGYVAVYLEPDHPDMNNSTMTADAFEGLFHAPTLDTFLRNDDGQMISRIMRTRQALTLYGEHLRQMAAS